MLTNRYDNTPHQQSEDAARSALAVCRCFYGRNLSVETEGPYLVLRGVVKTPFQREQVYRTVKKAIGEFTPMINEIELAVN